MYLAAFMAYTDPSAHYTNRLSQHQTILSGVSKNIRILGRLRLLTVLFALLFAGMAINSGITWQWILAIVLTMIFLIQVRVHSRLHHQEQMLTLRMGIAKGELGALEGNYKGFPQGDELIDSTHPYSFDLDIFGAGSVYQLLCRTTTLNGAQELAGLLMNPEDQEAKILDRQAMIRELGSEPVFLEDFRAAGLSAPEEKRDYELVVNWLQEPDYFINSLFAKVAIAVLPLLNAALIIYSILTATVHPLITLIIAVNWIVLGIFGKKIKSANIQVGRTAQLVEKFQRLQEVVAGASFRHPWLAGVNARAKGAAEQIVRFRKLANMFDSRNNMAGILMNSLFLFDIYCLLRLEGWRSAHKSLLLETMQAMIELDVLVSLANYAFNHPENTYPSFNTPAMQAVNLRHPLLAKSAMGNDFTLGAQEKIYLLTGANMTGKSTFIRTVGTTAVLSYTGVPVPADALSLPLMQLFTSIRVTDSVQNDVSYFRAELNRIKLIMDTVLAANRLYLVLLDEPLRGTNSGDKQQGTRAIIENLLQQKVMGIVATHDIGLCVLQEEQPGKVSNYHFESTVVSDGLAFDFKLHPGGSTSNNATILMRQMGIIK